ncbi:hypothetical protein GQ457_03G013450 [Hibiscus cannabinus]
MPLALDEVTVGGLNGGVMREEGMSGKVILEVRLREKNDIVRWWGNDLLEGSSVVSLPPPPMLDTSTDLVNVLIVEGDFIEGSDLNIARPVIKGSITEITSTHGSRRKVMLFSDVIQNVLSLEERDLAMKFSSRKGRGRPRKKVASSSIIMNISLSDSDLGNQKEAIFEEATLTVGFGKLLGVKKIYR